MVRPVIPDNRPNFSRRGERINPRSPPSRSGEGGGRRLGDSPFTQRTGIRRMSCITFGISADFDNDARYSPPAREFIEASRSPPVPVAPPHPSPPRGLNDRSLRIRRVTQRLINVSNESVAASTLAMARETVSVRRSLPFLALEMQEDRVSRIRATCGLIRESPTGCSLKSKGRGE